MEYTAEKLNKIFSEMKAQIDNKWVACRPINYKCENIFERIKQAIKVLKGKADIIIWYKQ